MVRDWSTDEAPEHERMWKLLGSYLADHIIGTLQGRPAEDIWNKWFEGEVAKIIEAIRDGRPLDDA